MPHNIVSLKVALASIAYHKKLALRRNSTLRKHYYDDSKTPIWEFRASIIANTITEGQKAIKIGFAGLDHIERIERKKKADIGKDKTAGKNQLNIFSGK